VIAATPLNDPQSGRFLERVRNLLSSQSLGVLGSRYEDAPHLSLIAFVASHDLREIHFASPASTRKTEAMRADPRVALLVDNRNNLSSDFDAASALTVKGVAEALSAEEALAVAPRYLQRHPSLKDFVASPSCLFFRIRIHSYSLVSSFQKVDELSLI